MIRKIIQIDKEKCNGCGACASVCHEGAIGMINGKATLLRDDYCDGLGDCLPVCPVDALRFVKREAPAYDEAAVKANQSARTIDSGKASEESQLSQWPVQMQLVSINASYFEGAHLLIAADCTAYACEDFHQHFMKSRVTLVGCPKLDHADYAAKLTEILRRNNIQSVSVVRMEVPCCRGLENAGKYALQECGKRIPCQVYTITVDGKIL